MNDRSDDARHANERNRGWLKTRRSGALLGALALACGSEEPGRSGDAGRVEEPPPNRTDTESRPDRPAWQASERYARGTHVVLLGSGTPNADPDRSGTAIAVVVEGVAYLVDAGPGVVRRASASARNGVEALLPARLDIVFLTHLHSDHTVGLPDLMLTPWVLERETPLRVFGPEGTREMTDHLLAAWRRDIESRSSGIHPTTPEGHRVEAVDVTAGVVYRDERVSVTAFEVPHAGVTHAMGYRFDTADRSVVISGDTGPGDAVAQACSGCDVLLHEVYSMEGLRRHLPEWQRYHSRAHTSTTEVAELAARARPGLLVLYHALLWGVTPDALVTEVTDGYEGPVVFGRDLDVY
jgi:ribonuclease BN (tRNA processing enzyme)